jgi:TonB family protein
MDAAPKLASTYAMHLSGCAMVCLCVTSMLVVGCGPEPTAKQPDPSASATSTVGAPPSGSPTAPTTSQATSTTGSSAASPSTASSPNVAPTNSASTSGNDTQPLVGTLSNAEIQKGINDNLQAFDACYTLGADKQGKLEGTVTIKATVGPLGKVIDAVVVKSTIKNAKVNDCVAAAFKKVLFPHPKGGVAIITYPMTFGGEVVFKKP